jgi:hypothetical protein
MFNSVVEGDLRLAINEALDKLVLDATAASPAHPPGTDSLIVSVRQAMTILQDIGYSPDTLILRPEDSEALDLLRENATDEAYVFSHLLPGAEDEAADLLDAYLARSIGSDPDLAAEAAELARSAV